MSRHHLVAFLSATGLTALSVWGKYADSHHVGPEWLVLIANVPSRPAYVAVFILSGSIGLSGIYELMFALTWLMWYGIVYLMARSV